MARENNGMGTGAPPILFVKKIDMAALHEKKTADCFNNERSYYRDSDIDMLLPKMQPAQQEGSVSVYQFQNEMSFEEMAAAVLNTVPYIPITEMGALIKERGYAIKLTTLEALIERQESGEDVGLPANGQNFAFFAFVENKHGGVSVLRVLNSGAGWFLHLYDFGGGGAWGVGERLLLYGSNMPTF
jgi:hypothetical protein